jgi:hypothetical protein
MQRTMTHDRRPTGAQAHGSRWMPEPTAGATNDHWDLAEVTDEVVDLIRTRRLDHLDVRYVEIETTALDDDKPWSSWAVVSAAGITAAGDATPLAVEVGDTAERDFWMRFFHSLRVRGVRRIAAVVTDEFRGLDQAVRTVHPSAVVIVRPQGRGEQDQLGEAREIAG